MILLSLCKWTCIIIGFLFSFKAQLICQSICFWLAYTINPLINYCFFLFYYTSSLMNLYEFKFTSSVIIHQQNINIYGIEWIQPILCDFHTTELFQKGALNYHVSERLSFILVPNCLHNYPFQIHKNNKIIMYVVALIWFPARW